MIILGSLKRFLENVIGLSTYCCCPLNWKRKDLNKLIIIQMLSNPQIIHTYIIIFFLFFAVLEMRNQISTMCLLLQFTSTIGQCPGVLI